MWLPWEREGREGKNGQKIKNLKNKCTKVFSWALFLNSEKFLDSRCHYYWPIFQILLLRVRAYFWGQEEKKNLLRFYLANSFIILFLVKHRWPFSSNPDAPAGSSGSLWSHLEGIRGCCSLGTMQHFFSERWAEKSRNPFLYGWGINFWHGK